MRIARARGEPVQCLRDALVGGYLRDELIDALSDHLSFDVPKNPFAGGIESLYDAILINGGEDVFDVIEDDVEMLGTLLAGAVSDGAGFIGHETHRLHDDAPLLVDGVVM